MKWDCDIIQDLIPSYVDGVCSEKSSAVVEEHLEECIACKKLTEQYRLTDFSADKLEERELNGMKKIRQRIKRQTMISYALGILLLLLGFRAFGGYGGTAQIIYDVLLPICMLGAYLTGTHTDRRIAAKRADHLLAAGSVVAMGLSVFVLYSALVQVMSGERILGVEPEQAGPRLAGIWAVCFMVQLVLLAVLWYRQHFLHVENRTRLCICITGMFLLMMYVEALRHLDSIEGVTRHYIQMSAVVLVIGTIGTGLCDLGLRRRSTL